MRCFCVVVKKAQKTAQMPSLSSLTSLGKNIPAVPPYTHVIPPVVFDKGDKEEVHVNVRPICYFVIVIAVFVIVRRTMAHRMGLGYYCPTYDL